MNWMVGIDTGGTFTDLMAINPSSGQMVTVKVPSTPDNPAKAILIALAQLREEYGVRLEQLSMLAHGTTVATNAVLEKKGVKGGLLITKGMRAIYDTRAGSHPQGADLIDPYYRKPELLIPPYLTREISERIAYDGTVVDHLDENSVREAVSSLKEEGVRSIAVCYLFSFRNSTHEQRTEEIIRETYPECRVSLSSTVLPVIREYPRLSTTVLDAYIGPVIQRYFYDLQARVQESGLQTKRIYIMQSNGGLSRISLAVKFPNETLLSGPAAGVVYGARLGDLAGQPNMLTFDMGGTSTDISVIVDGKVGETREGKIGGQDLGTPMIRIRTIGTGGGTIAYIGKDGLLKVGPHSSGAYPGPVCYNRGGTEPTVTDANVMLGYLDVNNFLGGRMKGEKCLSEKALTKIGKQLSLDPVEMAQGIVKIANTFMGVGLRTALNEQGADPRKFVLAAFGGSGPVHAAKLARETGISRVIVPRFPGLSCAMGLLNTDIKHVYLKSHPVRLRELKYDMLKVEFNHLIEQAKKDIEAEELREDTTEFIFQLDLRYPQQGYELPITLGRSLSEDVLDINLLRRTFDSEHERYYGISAPDEEPEMVNLRVILIGFIPQMSFPEVKENSSLEAHKGYRQAWFAEAGGFLNTPIYERSRMPAGLMLEGPAIIEQVDSTTVVEPGMKATVDTFGNIIINA